MKITLIDFFAIFIIPTSNLELTSAKKWHKSIHKASAGVDIKEFKAIITVNTNTQKLKALMIL